MPTSKHLETIKKITVNSVRKNKNYTHNLFKDCSTFVECVEKSNQPFFFFLYRFFFNSKTKDNSGIFFLFVSLEN